MVREELVQFLVPIFLHKAFSSCEGFSGIVNDRSGVCFSKSLDDSFCFIGEVELELSMQLLW